MEGTAVKTIEDSINALNQVLINLIEDDAVKHSLEIQRLTRAMARLNRTKIRYGR